MNFFTKECAISDMENADELAIVASRIYFVLLGMTIFILALFSGLIESKTSTTIQSPSLLIYDKLQAEYSQMLSCPCKQIAIPHKKFIYITVSFHQVGNLTE